MGGGSGGDTKLSAFELTVTGFITGTIEVVILQPMLYCKNATQQGLPLTLNPAVLYRGIAVSVGNMATLTSLQFPLTGAVKSAITGGVDRPLSDFEKIAAPAIGGAISGFACAPMELTMIQQQRFGSSLLATPGIIIGELGPLGMWRGLLMSCGREGIFTAGYLGMGPVFSHKLQEQGWAEVSSKLGGSICGGIIAASLSHPMDTIKTCMQGDIKRETYGTVTQTFSTLMKESGPQRFFSGWAWRTGRMCCAMGIMTECSYRVPQLLFPHHYTK